jgi:Uma2 family endonuclease
MALAKPIGAFSLEDYYALEAVAGRRSEYYGGEIFAMAGGSFRHSQICARFISELGQKLRGKACRPYDSNLRIKIGATGLVTYPDASVFCEPPLADSADKAGQTAVNPTVVVEVLSKSTEAYDRGKKAENYRQIESLKAYLLIAQSEPHIELYERHGDGFWFLTEAVGLEAVLAVPSLNIELALGDVYDGVDFGAEEAAPLT